MRRPARTPAPLPCSRLSVSLAALALALTSLGAACERRIEEPAPSRTIVDPSALHAGQRKAPIAAALRCIKPTPEHPVRTAPPSPDPRCPRDPEGQRELRTGKIVFPEAHDEAVSVEIAESNHDRMRGLMYRTSMQQNHGMIFVFEDKEEHSFWMHNTCIPLDMLFIDDDGLIVGIEENTPTMSDDTFTAGCASKYVLELNAGWTRAHGVKAGQRVALQGI